jgi:hypothetical protein
MPSDFPRSPKLLKGALVAYESQFLGPVPNVIVFQYNPDQLGRTLASRSEPPQPGNVGAAREDVLQVLGPPVENINLAVRLDASDQLEQPQQHPQIVQFGLHPALAALELLLYPKSSQILSNLALASEGKTEVVREDAPLVLFVWGRSRVEPVRLTSFSITEEAFDQALNPIRARVELGMRVLTFMELKKSSLGSDAYMATQVQKETMARLNLASSAEQVTGMLPF